MGAGCGKLEGHWKKKCATGTPFCSILKSSGKNWGMQAMSTNATPSRGSAAVTELLQLRVCSGNFGDPLCRHSRNGHATPLCKPHLPEHCTAAGNRPSVSKRVVYSQPGWNSRNPEITQTKINLFLRSCLDHEKMGCVPHCQGRRGCGRWVHLITRAVRLHKTPTALQDRCSLKILL